MVFLGWRDPFESTISKELSRLQNEMNTLFEKFFGRTLPFIKAIEYPAVNMYHDNDNLYLVAELPGVKNEDLDITLEEDSITIKGVKKTNAPEDVSYHRRERAQGSFNRAITLPTKVSPEKAKATLSHGILKIILPKADEVKPKKIEIKLG